MELTEERVREIVREEIELSGLRRKKRPSKYNLFMKECIKKKEGAIQERFRQCAMEYKKLKQEGKI